MNFDFIANVDTTAAAKELAINSAPHWDAFTTRQSFNGSPHVDTKCVPLRGSSSFLDSYKPNAKRRATAYAAMLPHTTRLVNHVLKHMNVRTVGNVLAVALKPGGYILPHIDEGAYPEHFHRFHIVVTDNPGCWFKAADEFAEPRKGDVFFFNHRSIHSVYNGSPDWRIHLIVDVTLKE